MIYTIKDIEFLKKRDSIKEYKKFLCINDGGGANIGDIITQGHTIEGFLRYYNERQDMFFPNEIENNCFFTEIPQ